MAIANSERLFVSILREVCAELGIRMQTYHGGWVLTLRKGARTEHIYGYDFSLNSAAAQQIAKDKAATFSILAEAGVPAIEHQLVMSPILPDYVPENGNWVRLRRLFGRWNRDVVCKPNDGTGGRDIFRAQSLVQLERAIHVILAKGRACAISPYVAVKDEYRVVMQNGQPLLLYRKVRPHVVGDGRRPFVDLLADWIGSAESNHQALKTKLKTLGRMETDARMLHRVPKVGEVIPVNWQHNLGQGASPVEMNPRVGQGQELVALANKTMNAMQLRVASVDMVVASPGKPQVLEVNSGIMMEQFAATSRQKAVAVYWSILNALFVES